MVQPRPTRANLVIAPRALPNNGRVQPTETFSAHFEDPLVRFVIGDVVRARDIDTLAWHKYQERYGNRKYFGTDKFYEIPDPNEPDGVMYVYFDRNSEGEEVVVRIEPLPMQECEEDWYWRDATKRRNLKGDQVTDMGA